jgi:hypothetical protein
MAKFERGDRVMATKDLGGGLFGGSYVRKGSKGVVTDPGGWASNLTVNFDGEEVKCEEEDVARIGRS